MTEYETGLIVGFTITWLSILFSKIIIHVVLKLEKRN